MQSLDVISVNLWHILVSLANLALLYFVAKKFLYGPVKKILVDRQNTIDSRYEAAEKAESDARENKKAYEEKLSGAKEEADSILQSAVNDAKAREKEILDQAKDQAEGILRRAEENAALEMKKAENAIKEEIVEVSAALSEKLLEREIKTEDHKDLIDRFIDEIGGENE